MKYVLRFFLPVLICLLFVSAIGARSKPQNLTVQPELHIQTASPDEPTVAAILTFRDLPKSCFESCSIVWYRDGVPIRTQNNFVLRPGAIAICHISTVFSAQTPASSEITAIVRWNGGSARADGTMLIMNYEAAHYTRLASLTYPYRITVNRDANVVTVHAIAEDGTYSLLQNTFLCSTGGVNTPVGSFYVGHKLRWHTLFGSKENNYQYVYGQYISGIVGNILFHSVPYYTPYANDLESEQYNMLGQSVSQGCIRLTVEAAKWIYDNCPTGTQVDIVVGQPLTVPRPTAPQIDLSLVCSGWDPTDPDPVNPWHNTDFLNAETANLLLQTQRLSCSK